MEVKDRSWVEVSKKALTHNFKVFKRAVSRKTIVAPVVKSNAYGHGLIECAKHFAKEGADFLCVDDIDEAITLRDNKIKTRILVLGYTLNSRINDAKKFNIEISVASLEQLETILGKRGKPLVVHLKIETGLHRRGIELNRLKTVLLAMYKKKNVSLAGVMSHFAAAEMAKARHKEYSEEQIVNMKNAITVVREFNKEYKDYFNPIYHMAGSAASLLFKDGQFDLIRPGVALYGLWPSTQTEQFTEFVTDKRIILKPAMTWKSIVAEIKNLKVGDAVGYDLTEVLSRDTKIAVVPVGYWHGYPWVLAGKSYVLIGGKRCKLIGRVAMDMMVVDITDVPKVDEGDEVVLVGKQKKAEITAEEIAELAGTINYEIVTRVNPLLKRIYLS